MNLSVMRDGSERIHYQDPAVPIYICYGNLRELSNMAALCHWHEDVELLLPIRGHLAYNVNGTRLLVGEGNAVFVNSRQLHYGFSPDGTDCDYICVCFKASLLCAHKHLYDRYVLPIVLSFVWKLDKLELSNSIYRHPFGVPILHLSSIHDPSCCPNNSPGLQSKLKSPLPAL